MVVDSLIIKNSYFIKANSEEKDPIIQVTKIKGEKDRFYDQWIGLIDQIIDDPNTNFIERGNDKYEYFVYSDKDDQNDELFTTCYLLNTEKYVILISYSSYKQNDKPLVFKRNQIIL